MWYFIIAFFIISLGFSIDEERRKRKKTLERMKKEEELDKHYPSHKNTFSHYPIVGTPTKNKSKKKPKYIGPNIIYE